MSLEERIFGGNTTLWEVLDTEGVTDISVEISRLQEQITTLGRKVDDNFLITETRTTAVQTELDGLTSIVQVQSEEIEKIPGIEIDILRLQQDLAIIDPNVIDDRLSAVETDLDSLTFEFNQNRVLVNQQIGTLQNQITAVNNQLSVVSNLALSLEAGKLFNTQLITGAEYTWAFRIAQVGYSRTVIFTGVAGVVIRSNIQYPADVLDTQTMTSYSTNIRLVATHDVFRQTNQINYPMLLGPCFMQRTGDLGDGPTGYMTIRQ